ncbi:MAG: hypothetical protein M3N25_06605 [Actinomycetota bacterium]|nr:hypothetical protein [Actinomycetota bacterium]
MLLSLNGLRVWHAEAEAPLSGRDQSEGDLVAFDEESARKKVERALAPGRNVGEGPAASLPPFESGRRAVTRLSTVIDPVGIEMPAPDLVLR